MYITTTAYKKISSLTKNIRVIQGGTRSSKTVSCCLYLITIAQSQKVVISIVGEDIPFLKRGVIRDFLDIMQVHGYYKGDNWNKSSLIYTFENGSIIEFFSANDPASLRGSKRHILFINEANNVTKEAFDELFIRTTLFCMLDFNPVSEFWAHELQDVDFIKLTYRDNEALDKRVIENIESKKDDVNWYRVYGLGEIGSLEGKIYENWEIIDKIPDFAEFKGYGLDFGYTKDPTAIVAIYKGDNGYYLDEITYETGLSNKQIAHIIRGDEKNNRGGIVIADSSEPKSIAEIEGYDIDIVGAIKGQGSVAFGIQVVKSLNIRVTAQSTNIIKEMRNYTWKKNKFGKSFNVPSDVWNHSMDAIRYGITHFEGVQEGFGRGLFNI